MFLILLFLKKRSFPMKLKRKQTFTYFVHCKFKQCNGGERTPWTFYLRNIKLQSFCTCIHFYTIVVPKYFHFCIFISLRVTSTVYLTEPNKIAIFKVKMVRYQQFHDSTFILKRCIFIYFHLKRVKVIHSSMF